MGKLRFSGHESFHCRHFWLKKGYEFNERHQGVYSIDDAVVELGVGKNMVSAIDFWLKAFGVKDEDKNLTELGQKLIGEGGFDPYLEDVGTLWLLQYSLLSTNFASIYKLILSDYRRARVSNEFNKNQIKNFLSRRLDGNRQTPYNENTANTDIKVFLKNYLPPEKKMESIEDDFSSLFIDLGILSQKVVHDGEEPTYKFLVNDRQEIPTLVFLFAILDSFEDDASSISFSKISDRLRDVFMITSDGIEKKLMEIVEQFPKSAYKGDGGRKELQLKGCGTKWDVLKTYYHG